MNLDPDDIRRLALEVRRFLNKGGVLTRLTGMAKLYLEFPDIDTMHHVHQSILIAMPPEAFLTTGTQSETYVDDHTIEIAPFAGISIILSCKQRFATTSGGSLGYRDVAFVTRKLDDKLRE